MLLRDEIDIIVQNLEHLLSWIDALYILDMGSVDGTWEIVMDYARRDPRIVPFFSRPVVYDDNLRCTMFDQYRDRFKPGDFVMKIDADEFYQVLPPRFVAERMTPSETAAYLQWYFFRLTTQEVADYESGKVNIMEDRKRPIEDRRRFYKISTYAEPRLFKYRRSMQWPQNVSFPYNAGLVARQRIPIRHYPHRDPLQMETRFRLRANMMKLKAHAGGHWKLDDWRKELVDASGASTGANGEEKVGLASQKGVDTGPLYYWEPGTPLNEIPQFDHISNTRMRIAQRLTHAMLLPILDSRRPHYDKSYQPVAIPPEMVSEMYK
jgi:glycosyltransferase involved in cell wall biosynthesis